MPTTYGNAAWRRFERNLDCAYVCGALERRVTYVERPVHTCAFIVMECLSITKLKNRLISKCTLENHWHGEPRLPPRQLTHWEHRTKALGECQEQAQAFFAGRMVEVKISFDLGGGLARTLAGRWWCRDWWGRYFEDDKLVGILRRLHDSTSRIATAPPQTVLGDSNENTCPFVWTKSAKHSQKLELCFNSPTQCPAPQRARGGSLKFESSK